jgi:hypothetical protein
VCRWTGGGGGFSTGRLAHWQLPTKLASTPISTNCKGMIAMADNLLIAMIIAGFGLSGAYFRAVFVSWRRMQAAERKREISLRESHAHRLCRDENEVTGSNTVQMEKRVDRVPKVQLEQGKEDV